MVPESVAEIVRRESGRVVAAVFRMTGDLDLAEDAYVDAAVEAFARWPSAGLPTDPGAWLTTVARHAALVRLHDDDPGPGGSDPRAAALVADPDPLPAPTVRDDQLRLVATCCDPALPRDAQVALLLRLLGGLTTAELARVFMTTEDTMGERIAAAKAELRDRQLDDPPSPTLTAPGGRLPGVLAAVHLVFGTGHLAGHGQDLRRVDLAEEGLRLARLLTDLLPDEPECLGLLALLESVHARRATRLDPDGNPVLLADADRGRWDRQGIADADALLRRASRAGRVGPYQLQAEISLLHSSAATDAATDWERIADCYGRLDALEATPFVRVNRAVAEGAAHGPAAGLAILESADGLDGWHLFHATRSDLLAQAGRPEAAADALRAALACEPNAIDRRLLEERLARLTLP